MAVLSSDLVCKCPCFERSKLEFGSYRWNPYFHKDNTEGSLRDPVTTDSYIDEMDVLFPSYADSFFKYFMKDESIVCASSNRRISENVKKKLCLSKVILSTAQTN